LSRGITKEGIRIVRAQDIQRGIGNISVPYDFLIKIGSAATLSLYIRGLGFLNYQLLKDFAFQYLDIPYPIFDDVIRILEEIEFVEVIEKDGQKLVNPKIPYFEDLYNKMGEYAKIEDKFDEREKVTLAIADKVSYTPYHIDKLLSISDDKNLVNWVIDIGKKISYIDTIKDEIVFSPIYFMENPSVLNELIQRVGEEEIERAINAIRQYEGFPIGPTSNGETTITKTIRYLTSKKILQPYTIEDKVFIFTPIFPTEKLQIVDRKYYEKAIALVSAIRYGENFADWKIRDPAALLRSFKMKGFLRPNPYANLQYSRPELTGIIYIKPVGNGFYETHLIENPDNIRIIEIAQQLISSHGEIVQDRHVDMRLKMGLSKGRFKDILPSYKEVEKESVDSSSDKKLESFFESLMFGVPYEQE